MNRSKLIIGLIIGLILIVGAFFLIKPTSSLKEYQNPSYNYVIKYPSSFVLEEKQEKTDSGNLNYVLLNSTEKNGINNIYLAVIPTSIEDLEFYENFYATNPSLKPKPEKVVYGVLEGYEQPATTGLEKLGATTFLVFDKNRGYWIRYEISYDKGNIKTEEDAKKITNQILSSFKWLDK